MKRLTENAVVDFMANIYKSWTWARMTDAEQKVCNDLFFWETPTKSSIKGTYEQRVKICYAIYHSYLLGLGYTDGFWREPETDENPTF